jgi:pimeloyl-ACP methyl ester carboxylesterase
MAHTLLLAVSILCEVTGSAPSYSEHQDLSYYLRADGSRAAIRTPADWQHRRAHIIAGMEEAMGPFPQPASPVPLDVEVLEEHKEDGYVRRKVAYHTDDPKQAVHAWLLLPLPLGEGRGEGALSSVSIRRPAMLCLHQTTPSGKDSPVGLADRLSLHYALELTNRGYVTLSPDYPSFGESKDYDFDTDKYVSGTMKAIYDNTRAIDLLQSLPEVDPSRIGVIGHSLGGHNALFTAVFDPRIKAVVTSCGFTSFHKYKGGDLRGWTSPRYMPLIATKYHNAPDEIPFDFPEVLAAIAPRAVFISAPLHDDNFDIGGVRDCVNAARPIYKLLDWPDGLQVVHPDCAHDFPDTARMQAYDFLLSKMALIHLIPNRRPLPPLR